MRLNFEVSLINYNNKTTTTKINRGNILKMNYSNEMSIKNAFIVH